MVLEQRKWNVVAGLAIILVLTHMVVVSAAWLMGRITFEQYGGALLPMLTGVLGYVAKLVEDKGSGS